MRKLLLKEIREVEIELLRVFKSFCVENDIQYFISNGTLLGAVKYKGFIPWDDDIDVLVPRKDYNKLISLFTDNEQYKLFAFEKESEYRYPFAKLCHMGTIKKEENINNGVQLGVDIDIFPLDSWNSDFNKAKREVKYIRRHMFFLGLAKLYKPDSLNLLKREVKRVLIIFCKMIGCKYFIQRIIKESNRTEQTNSIYWGCKSWCIYGEREIIPAQVFADVAEIEFEGETFSAPIGYDTYLRSLYGNYKQDPPIEKQVSHHKYEAYEI